GEAEREQREIDDERLQKDRPAPVGNDVQVHPLEPEEERAGDDAEPTEIDDGAEIGLGAGDAGNGDGLEIGEGFGADVETRGGRATEAADGGAEHIDFI